LAKPKSRRAKRKGGLGEMNFCPPAVPRSGTEGGKHFRNSALAEYQNRKIFVSLIEQNFGGAQLKNVKKIFLFCSLSGERKRRVGPALCVKGRDVAQRRFALRPAIATNLNIANFAGSLFSCSPRLRLNWRPILQSKMFRNTPNLVLVFFNDFFKQLFSYFSDIFNHVVVFSFVELGSGKKEMLFNADEVHYGNA